MQLFADVDVDVKNGANLLDRLVKDIVTESESFDVDKFIPLLQKYIRMTNPYVYLRHCPLPDHPPYSPAPLFAFHNYPTYLFRYLPAPEPACTTQHDTIHNLCCTHARTHTHIALPQVHPPADGRLDHRA